MKKEDTQLHYYVFSSNKTRDEKVLSIQESFTKISVVDRTCQKVLRLRNIPFKTDIIYGDEFEVRLDCSKSYSGPEYEYALTQNDVIDLSVFKEEEALKNDDGALTIQITKFTQTIIIEDCYLFNPSFNLFKIKMSDLNIYVNRCNNCEVLIDECKLGDFKTKFSSIRLTINTSKLNGLEYYCNCDDDDSYNKNILIGPCVTFYKSVNITTNNSDISFESCNLDCGNVSIQTIHGNVSFVECKGSELSIQSLTGNIEVIKHSSKCGVSCIGITGNIDVYELETHSKCLLKSIEGNIRCKNSSVRSNFEIKTVNGDISGIGYNKPKVQTISGKNTFVAL